MNMEGQVIQVNIDDIIPNRFQPRIAFDEKALNELASSIKEHGIIQPLVLRKLGKKYEIIAGERRYKAATLAGLQTVPAVISNIDDNKSAEVALVENIQRRDLTPIEEARSYKNLLDKGYLTQEQLAKKMGLSQSAISNKLRLLNLDNSIQQALLDNKISERHARSLLTLTDKEEQKKWLDKIIKERLTVKQLDEALKKDGNDDTGDVPLVNLTPNIEEIKEQATDLNSNKPKNIANMLVSEDTMTEYSNNLPNNNTNVQPNIENELGNQPSLESATNTLDDLNNSVSPFNDIINTSNPMNNQEVLNVAPPTNNKFFNQLEDEPAAMTNLNPFAATSIFAIDNTPSNNEVEVFDVNPTPAVEQPPQQNQEQPQILNNDLSFNNINNDPISELNLNNKFFQPIQDNSQNIEPLPNSMSTNNQASEVNPMDYVDNLNNTPTNNSYSLVDGINEVRELVNNLNNKGLNVKIDEADLDASYQINISISK